MCEARVMAEVWQGHPNLPLFIGVYEQIEHPKPSLVMKFYSVDGEPYTLHKYLREYRSECDTPQVADWARILLGICDGLDAIHKKGYLHNDLVWQHCSE